MHLKSFKSFLRISNNHFLYVTCRNNIHEGRGENIIKSPPVFILQINVADIEYWDRDSDLMQVLVVHGEYPPRFAVDVSGSGMTDESHAHFVFFGATEELVYKLPLLPE